MRERVAVLCCSSLDRSLPINVSWSLEMHRVGLFRGGTVVLYLLGGVA
jgi:hypothetical protein